MKSLFKVIFLNISFLGLAQETLPIYQQYLLDGKFLINPAHYGETDDVVFHATYQKQFSKFEQSPNVQSLGTHANIVDRLGAGVSFFRDENGAISANGVSLGASYFIPIGDDLDRKNQFSFGTNVNFYNMNVDNTLLNAKDNNDPLLHSGINSIFISYANLGMQVTYNGFFTGLSVLDIPLSNNVPIVNGIEPSPTKYLLNTGYDYTISEGISIEPSILFNLNTNSSRMLDINLIGKLYNDENQFSAGVSLRTGKDSVGSSQLSLSPILKAKINRLNIGATYNFSMGKVAPYAGNSFMLSLGYNFSNFINTRGFR